MSVLGAGMTVVSGYKALSGLGIGRKKNYDVGDCGEPVPSAVSEMLQNLPQQEYAKLATAYSKANGGERLPENAGLIAFKAYGGNDCRISSDSGKQFKRVFDEMMEKFGPGGINRTSASNSINESSNKKNDIAFVKIIGYTIAAALLTYGLTLIQKSK